MRLQAVIIERVILSALITVVAAIATNHNGSSIDGLSFVKNITPLSELDGNALNKSLYQIDYTLSQNRVMNTQVNQN